MPPPATALVSIEPLQLVPALAFGVMYLVRARRLAAGGRPVPGWRRGCFLGGLGLMVLTLVSPLGALADELFAAHMAEHLLLADLGALLVVLGLTGPLLAPLLRTTALGWLRHLAHPVPAFGLWAADLFFWHIVGPHEAAVNHAAVHAVQHMLFVGLGINMWMALFGPLPKPAWFGNFAKLVYIVVVRLLGAVLGNVLVFDSTVLYPVYGEPVADQSTAGAIMMVESSLLTLGLFCWLFLKAMREAEERQELKELAVARGVEVTDQRVARAVSAGRGAELRRRIEAGSVAR
jgi:putative membrane protein